VAAEARFGEFSERWHDRYPAMIRLWERAWREFVPFLEFPPAIRKVICTTNAIESLNARFRRTMRRRGHCHSSPSRSSSSTGFDRVPATPPGWVKPLATAHPARAGIVNPSLLEQRVRAGDARDRPQQ
jgi:hypothetical protein